ncbi:Methylthioribulose-1-phosphate dehydratase [Pseudobythopirellula maris]|uniref:Methylthioribulose-1-phosphate dehydratase n=1 Tax=Pseudobythopirellula maris TaxID=2527991 RepID=A0A5C5ZFI2_9BACT|nr:methylthioribulose 1-phosphate dehydratase [Pseudobythopirellula maris]TWT86209.1 Methylthioribulose-1-phosphate dehydratase [Pseudobythopirellula maris]
MPAMTEEALLLDDLSATGADFHRRGWSLATSSNFSVRVGDDPLELMITKSGKDKGRLGREDYVRVGVDGRPTESGAAKSSAETMLHVVLADAAGAGSVLHTHSVWDAATGERGLEAGGVEIAGYEMLKGLDGIATHDTAKWIDVFPNTQDIPRLAEEVRARLADPQRPMQHGFLIHRHGLYAWGADIAAARRHIEAFQYLFECEARRLAACS